MKSRLSKLIQRTLFFCLILFLVQMSELWFADIPTGDNMGYRVYFSIQNSGRESLYIIILLLILPMFTLTGYFNSINNRHCNYVINRIGTKRYFLLALKETFLVGVFSRLGVEVLSVLSIHFFYSRINLNEILTHYTLVNSDPLTNIVVYILLASIGTGIFSCFWFSTIYLIKNKYIFQGIMVFWQFISMIIFMLLAGITGTHTDKGYAILTCITPSSLLTPGQIYESECILNFFSGAVFYCAITLALLYYSYKQRLKYA